MFSLWDWQTWFADWSLLVILVLKVTVLRVFTGITIWVLYCVYGSGYKARDTYSRKCLSVRYSYVTTWNGSTNTQNNFLDLLISLFLRPISSSQRNMIAMNDWLISVHQLYRNSSVPPSIKTFTVLPVMHSCVGFS